MDRSSLWVVAALGAAGGVGMLPSGAPGVPAVSASAPQQQTTVEVFLATVREVDPVVCELVGHALGNTWGGGSLTPHLSLPERTGATMEMVRWARRMHDEPGMIPSLRNGLEDADPCVRQTAARLFDHVRDRRAAVAAVTDALASSRPTTRRAAAMALGHVEDRQTVSALVRHISSDDPLMRQAVTWALGQIEDDAALAELVQALDDADAGVRGNAAWALGQIEERAAVTPLTVALRDPDEAVRFNAAMALGRIEDAGAIPALADLLARDRSADVRKAAAWALGQIG